MFAIALLAHVHAIRLVQLRQILGAGLQEVGRFYSGQLGSLHCLHLDPLLVETPPLLLLAQHFFAHPPVRVWGAGPIGMAILRLGRFLSPIDILLAGVGATWFRVATVPVLQLVEGFLEERHLVREFERRMRERKGGRGEEGLQGDF